MIRKKWVISPTFITHWSDRLWSWLPTGHPSIRGPLFRPQVFLCSHVDGPVRSMRFNLTRGVFGWGFFTLTQTNCEGVFISNLGLFKMILLFFLPWQTSICKLCKSQICCLLLFVPNIFRKIVGYITCIKTSCCKNFWILTPTWEDHPNWRTYFSNGLLNHQVAKLMLNVSRWTLTIL